MTHWPLVRVPLTLVAALAFHVSMSPPTGPAPLTSDPDIPSDRHRKICATARFITIMTTKGLYWASAFTDTVVLLAPYVPTSLPHISIPPKGARLSWIRGGLSLGLPVSVSVSLPFLLHLPLVTIAGTTLALTGALLRYTAYHALGQFYACPNTGTGTCKPRGGARHAHALITTGPYAFVRHPGYAGLVLSTTGLVMFHLDVLKVYLGLSRVSPWGVDELSVGMRTVALVCAMLGTVGAVRRIRDEERTLRVRFKGEWEAWAGRVRYRLVPGVY